MTNREEVAKKLRKNSTAHTTDEAFQIICKCTIRTVKGSKGVIEALADLIDPTCNPVEAGNNIVCSECGADLYDDDLYCSRSGSRVVRRNDQA